MKKILPVIVFVLFFSLVGSVFGGKLPDGSFDYYKNIEQFKLLGLSQSSPAAPWMITAVLGKGDDGATVQPTQKPILTEKLILVLERGERYRIIMIWHRRQEKNEIITVGCHADHDYLETLGSGKPKWVTFEPSRCEEGLGDFLQNLDEIIGQKKEEE
ncbi:MAG: hypothetical protein AAB474_02320 [Patescibacteria group bacterium]